MRRLPQKELLFLWTLKEILGPILRRDQLNEELRFLLDLVNHPIHYLLGALNLQVHSRLLDDLLILLLDFPFLGDIVVHSASPSSSLCPDLLGGGLILLESDFLCPGLPGLSCLLSVFFCEVVNFLFFFDEPGPHFACGSPFFNEILEYFFVDFLDFVLCKGFAGPDKIVSQSAVLKDDGKGGAH